MLIRNLLGKSPNDSVSSLVAGHKSLANPPQDKTAASVCASERLTINDQRLKLLLLSPPQAPAAHRPSPRDKPRTRQASERSVFRLDTCPPARQSSSVRSRECTAPSFHPVEFGPA